MLRTGAERCPVAMQGDGEHCSCVTLIRRERLAEPSIARCSSGSRRDLDPAPPRSPRAKIDAPDGGAARMLSRGLAHDMLRFANDPATEEPMWRCPAALVLLTLALLILLFTHPAAVAQQATPAAQPATPAAKAAAPTAK